MQRSVLVLVLAVATTLLTANLGNVYLWQDEAQTALVAGTILEHGLPLGTDGKNLFTQTGGLEYGDDYVWSWHPWLPFYLLAPCLKLLGSTTLAARLPFALLSVGTLYLTFLLARALFGQRAAWIALLLLLTCVPFLLLGRQCRYYSPVMFFTVATLWAYASRRHAWSYGLGLVLLFHCGFPYTFVLAASVSAHACFFETARRRAVLLAGAVAISVCVPFLFTLYETDYAALRDPETGLSRIFGYTLKYCGELLRHGPTPGILLGSLVLLVLRWRRGESLLPRRREPRSGLALLLGVIVAALSLYSVTSYFPAFRDLGPLLPVLAVLGGFVGDALMGLHRGLVLVPASSVLLLNPLPSFLYEITHDFDGPIEGIVDYLNAHGSQEDTVLISYGDLPVKYYTGMRVLGGMTSEPLGEAIGAEWIIMRKHVVSPQELELRLFARRHADLRRYEAIELPYPDTMFQTREDPDRHLYRTAKDEANVVLLHRR